MCVTSNFMLSHKGIRQKKFCITSADDFCQGIFVSPFSWAEIFVVKFLFDVVCSAYLHASRAGRQGEGGRQAFKRLKR